MRMHGPFLARHHSNESGRLKSSLFDVISADGQCLGQVLLPSDGIHMTDPEYERAELSLASFFGIEFPPYLLVIDIEKHLVTIETKVAWGFKTLFHFKPVIDE